jgi:ferredoxin-NADP reductase
VAAPRGTFILQPGERPVVLISGGVGATPVMAMLHALAAERCEREVWWVHGARNRAEHSFRQESARLLSSLPRARRLIAFSKPDVDDQAGVDFDLRGRLSGTHLDALGVPTNADFYICGPAAFMDEVAAALAARGVAPERVRTEVFGPQEVYRSGLFSHKPPPAPSAGRGARVGAADPVQPQQPVCSLGPLVRNPARPRRGL